MNQKPVEHFVEVIDHEAEVEVLVENSCISSPDPLPRSAPWKRKRGARLRRPSRYCRFGPAVDQVASCVADSIASGGSWLNHFFVDRRVGAVVDRLLQAFVEFVEQLVVALRRPRIHTVLRSGSLLEISMPPSASTAFSATGMSITTASTVPAFERVDRVGALGKARTSPASAFSFDVIPRPVVPCWAPTVVPSRSSSRVDVAAFLDQDRLFGEVVRVGEVDRFLAFVGDRRAEATASNLPWARSRKIVSNEVSWNSASRPMFSAIASIRSMSKPL